ncbi:RNA-binding S4 domain-containing protein [Acidiphilium sp. AL]|uniref:RNA-binding S4 domain-containing protein n=1 Tax=Acidiphilium iwatense TaxID=768198 RepID=A0ABS9DVS9_9PROT|nr:MULTISPECIES: RNA-binding S4 domain-containing protein [Acidiphilium]MCF3946845.1 RNA-binding S4 domain-containing protein [Acidiphilium iwatense]MCU4161030.1 RNA-binding S4 domain-containing protein [Acidiphilium sp. AL]
MPLPDGADEDAAWQRLDKFLFHARFVKTRGLAGRLIAAGSVRINRQVTEKPHARLRQGDVLTLALPMGVRVVRVRAIGKRRGPSTEARLLYEEIAEQPP